MLLLLVLLFTVLPTVEIALLVGMWNAIGLPLTLAIALGTGIIGATLARQQGLMTLSRIGRQMSAGQAPGDALIDGAMILIAGAVLITPGVLTDAVGFSLLLPPVRAALKPLLKAYFRRRMTRHATNGGAGVWTFGAAPPTPPGADVVEAEVIEVRTNDATEP